MRCGNRPTHRYDVAAIASVVATTAPGEPSRQTTATGLLALEFGVAMVVSEQTPTAALASSAGLSHGGGTCARTDCRRNRGANP